MSQKQTESDVYEAVWLVISRRVAERAAAAVELVDDLIHASGQLRRRDQELMAGDRVLNGDRELLPRLARATSLGINLYLGNRRVASSSVLDAGDAMEVGGFADATVVDTVLRRREVYRGTVDLAGRSFMLASRPLYASDKSDEYGPIGMVEAFQDVGAFREMLVASMRDRTGTDTRSQLELQADRMESVMHFIDDVARRLQLLALNGNIIAAQAGDHGRAFRVVCRELSSLAEQSKEAVAEVRKLTQAMGLDGSGDSYAPFEDDATLDASEDHYDGDAVDESANAT
ncbi:methyl-accepting chemotaxis protein [Paraliomyxa miuraensis]|uniref:methyl-accepting chemotaxis protein n=1 Tax=Paraliomyxa miuraensis TaxID=376150 RepID=UPI0022515294|nr:methyl-accepting chemotaxis protein [Paraliomyxa miuraensis]MCX4243229.1 methyl-accepting chemotaxis protein [Paraliomyxa miuraensis]